MFASNTTSNLTIDGVSVKIKKLSFRQLAKAADIRQTAALKMTSAVGADMMRALRDQAPVEPKAPVARTVAYSAYDVDSVLKDGIVSWSSDLDIAKGIEDLTEEAAQKIFKSILDLSIVQPTDEVPKD